MAIPLSFITSKQGAGGLSRVEDIPIVRLFNLLLTNYLYHPSTRLIRAQIKVDYTLVF